MALDSIIQAKVEKDLLWKRTWPRCFLALLAVLEILFGVVIFFTELLNIAMDFWHTNVFGGFWAAFVIFINWILIYVTICCKTTIGASTCALMWNLLTLVAMTVLIVFDVIFILNPKTCILTANCSNQSQVISLTFLLQLIPGFKNYSSFDLKRFFLIIQVSCAGAVFLISVVFLLIYLICRSRMNSRIVQGNSVQPAPSAPTLPPDYFPYAPDVAIARPPPPPLYPTLEQN